MDLDDTEKKDDSKKSKTDFSLIPESRVLNPVP